MATKIRSQNPFDLKPFRRRILAVQSWQFASIGGILGSSAAVLAILADYFDFLNVSPLSFLSFVLGGVALGAIAGLLRNYSDMEIASSVDRRSRLEDRLTTVLAQTKSTAPERSLFLDALRLDTNQHLFDVDVNKIYPIRFKKQHAFFVGLMLTSGLLYIALETPLLLSAQARHNAAQMKQAAQQVQTVTKPLLDQANKPGASAADKALAADIRRFIHQLDRNQLSKPDALIRANQLAEQAQRLEQQRSQSLSTSVGTAITAGQSLQDMAQRATLQQSDSSKLADHAAALQQQISSIESQMAAERAARSGSSEEKLKELSKQLSDLQRALQQIQVSLRAQRMLELLQQLPQYQEAMEIMAKKAQIAEAMKLLNQLQSGSSLNDPTPTAQPQLSSQQMKQIADQLDALAAQLNTDAKMRAYAQALLEAAKAARAGDQVGIGVGIDAAMGINTDEYNGAPPDYGGNGSGSTSPGTWVGDHGKLNQASKSTLLNLKFQDQYVTSQQGANGSESYTEELGPARLDAKSGIPYQAILPKYEKTAESALNKSDIPPEMQTKVRDYFESLHGGE